MASIAPTALEQSFRDICASHNLTCINVQWTRDNAEREGWFTSFVQAGDLCAGGSDDKLAEAISKAIAKLGESRRTTLADEALSVELAA